MKRYSLTFLLSSLLFLLAATPTLAGGWTVVTIDELPRQFRANEPTTLGFTVRQHGQQPINLENVVLTANQQQSGAHLTFTAKQKGAVGHYVVDVLLPTAGEWNWEIQPDWFPPVQFAPIAVVSEVVAETTSLAGLLPWFLTGCGVLVLGGAALLPWPVGRRLRVAAGVGGLLLLVSGLSWAARLPNAVAAQPTTNLAAYGRTLFVAKGCNTCHLHAEALNTWSTESGPTLTDYQNSAQYLRGWLKDPQAIKPDTEMPNLALNAQEIEALTAFLRNATP